MSAAASSPLISIATPSTSASSRCNSKPLYLQSPIVSIPKTHFKTPKFSLNFNTHYLDLSPVSRSSLLSPNCFASDEVLQVVKNPESEKDDDEESEPESSESERLFVGRLPYPITSSELSQVFGEAGTVVSVKIFTHNVKRSRRAYAFITMASVEEAQEAIRMFNGSEIGGSLLRVRFQEATRPKIRSSDEDLIESPHKLVVRNLNWIITTEKLKEVFAGRPGVLSAKVVYQKTIPRSLGFGFVTFSSAEAAESTMIAMNGMELEGRPLRLDWYTVR